RQAASAARSVRVPGSALGAAAVRSRSVLSSAWLAAFLVSPRVEHDNGVDGCGGADPCARERVQNLALPFFRDRLDVAEDVFGELAPAARFERIPRAAERPDEADRQRHPGADREAERREECNHGDDAGE